MRQVTRKCKEDSLNPDLADALVSVNSLHPYFSKMALLYRLLKLTEENGVVVFCPEPTIQNRFCSFCNFDLWWSHVMLLHVT